MLRERKGRKNLVESQENEMANFFLDIFFKVMSVKRQFSCSQKASLPGTYSNFLSGICSGSIL